MARHAGANKLDKLIAAFKSCDRNGSGTIDKAELGKVVRQCNLGCSKAELLNMFECLDLSEDGEISLKEFTDFFSSHVNTQANAKRYNRLLVKPTIGKSKHSSYNLPGDYHRYGRSVQRDPEGAKEVILSWQPFNPSSMNDKKINFVKMNRAAVKHKCRTAHDFAEYNGNNKIYDEKTMCGSRSRKEMLEKMRHRPELQNLTFGVKKQASDPISSLITGSYNVSMTQASNEPFYPVVTAKVNRKKQRGKLKNFSGSTRATELRLGSLKARRDEEGNSNQAKFKMKRYANVPSRLQMGGMGVISME